MPQLNFLNLLTDPVSIKLDGAIQVSHFDENKIFGWLKKSAIKQNVAV